MTTPKQLSLFDSTPQAADAASLSFPSHPSETAHPPEIQLALAASATSGVRSRMHYAHVENSPRLQRVLAFLRERGDRGATTLEIGIECKVAAASTYISELRHCGYDIMRACITANGSRVRVHRYWLVGDGGIEA